MTTSSISQIITVQKNKVAQVVSSVLTTKQATTLTTANTFVAVTSPSVTITPTNSSSRILLFISLTYAGSSTTSHIFHQVLRDGAAIGGGTGGSTHNCSFGSMIGAAQNITTTAIEYDLPGDTSAHTYSLQAASDTSSDHLYINRTSGDANNNTNACCTSSIVAMEILP
jgi:hypothetical protein